MCFTVKPVGEPDAGDRHVRFDERGWETGRCRMAQATAPILASTEPADQLKSFPAEVNRGIPKGQVGGESMRIDSPLGGEPCAARIPVKCEYESLDLLKREHRGGKPPSSWRSAQVPQLDGCSTGKLSA